MSRDDNSKEKLDFAEIDHDRERRCGFPEVVFCPGKEPGQAAAIAQRILSEADRVLLTRAEPEHAEAVSAALPAAVYHRRARVVIVDPRPLPKTGLVAVIAAGTADLPIAEEADLTLDTMGVATERHVDVGVAGLHRILERIDDIRRAECAIVVAGMDGALPTVVAGLVDMPVIAVPTSVGYGSAFDGLAPLLTMLNSCAGGVSVVNIDNGFGAAYSAALIHRQIHRHRQTERDRS